MIVVIVDISISTILIQLASFAWKVILLVVVCVCAKDVLVLRTPLSKQVSTALKQYAYLNN